ncbi:MAG: CoA-transferase [Dehalococcoidia bacterium]|jgi:acyl CoA:acetate/3-ketoacid CoA transferase alpha subunit|nr:CoA-transferase [Dehalococcoidia bacterium]
MQVLEQGSADYFAVDPDGHRAWVREHKERRQVSKLMDEHEAVARFVADGDYMVYDCNYYSRGPSSLLREVMRQGKHDIWLCGKFTYVAVSLLVGAGVVSAVDVGFFGRSKVVEDAVRDGSLTMYEYSNVTLTLRLRGGAQGLPFVAARSWGGTDGFEYSGAKLVQDPFTEKPITLLPSLNPDVALIHAHQADEFGNARIFGTGIAHQEAAMASKKVIISAEEIVSAEEMKRNPGANSIPYYVVDAVVEAPFGAYPGIMAGIYSSDAAHIPELYTALASDSLDGYLDKWVHSVGSHEEMLAERVGVQRLLQLRREEIITEGYRA